MKFAGKIIFDETENYKSDPMWWRLLCQPFFVGRILMLGWLLKLELTNEIVFNIHTKLCQMMQTG